MIDMFVIFLKKKNTNFAKRKKIKENGSVMRRKLMILALKLFNNNFASIIVVWRLVNHDVGQLKYIVGIHNLSELLIYIL